MAAETGTQTTPPTVVIVDDEPSFLRVISDLITASQRFEVVGEATCGADALNLIIDVEADVVILDVQMPGLNGFETAQQMLSSRPDLRIVITSGIDESVYHELSTAVGAVGFVPKRQLSVEALSELVGLAGPEAATR